MDTWIERRRSPRIDIVEEISFTVSMIDMTAIRNVKGSATTINRSAEGSCIRTDVGLEPGQVLMVTAGPRVNLAIVQWVRRDSAVCVAGLMHV